MRESQSVLHLRRMPGVITAGLHDRRRPVPDFPARCG